MLYRIFGRAGSGKTEYLINCLKEKQSVGADCLFLVPEQHSVDTELRLEKAGATALGTEVLNFERLPNHVFRTIGGLNTTAVDGVGKTVLVRRALLELKEQLRLYTAPSAKDIGELRETVSAIKRLGVSADDLKNKVKDIKSDGGLGSKLQDLILIYKQYENLLGNDKTDDEDGLKRLNKALEGTDFFKGCSVFIDGIYTFTPNQYDIIARISESAEDIYVSFLCDEDESGIFNGTFNCAEKIKSICPVPCKDIFLRENYGSEDKALRYLEEKLWHRAAPYGEKADSISLAQCKDRYEESLRAASEIYALRGKGYDFNSIAVACRHPENYSGILDEVLRKYGIPFYFAEKDSAATKPLSAFIMGVLDIAAEKAPLWAIKKYLKSNFSILRQKEADELIHYGESWRINGNGWLKDSPWLMNPSGYRESISPADEALLNRINKAKALLAQSLSPTVEGLRSKELTVEKGVRLIYSHLKDCGGCARLEETARSLELLGDTDGAAKTYALWGLTVDIFDRLCALAGDMPVTAGELRALIGAMLEAGDLGAIPTLAHGVSIGDARLMRSDGVRAMIILGVNEGEFPSLPKKSGVFNHKESQTLEKHGIELLPPTDKAIDEERFFFYVACTAPSEYLSVSCITADGATPSPAFTALGAMFPHNTVYPFGEDERDYMFCTKAAEDIYPYIKNPRLKESLKAYLLSVGCKGIDEDCPPLQDSEAYVKESHKQKIILSYSKMDCYNNCGFSYLLRYVLKLRDDRNIRFSSVDTGTYLHYIMEHFLDKRKDLGGYVNTDRKGIKNELDVLTEAYVSKVFPTPPAKRLAKHIDRLKNVACFVCEQLCNEFENSAFVPDGFEVKIGSGGVAPPVLISKKGRTVSTNGYIDRVDKAVIDGKKYIRVVDYKSSEKSLNAQMIERGEGLQMLSYLFTYCDNDKEGALPAGVLYRSFELPKDGKTTKQKGMVINDEAVITAMDGRGKAGCIGAVAVSDEELALYREQTFNHMTETADKILDGEMCVSPFKKKSTDCGYCPYGEVCRQKKESWSFS